MSNKDSITIDEEYLGSIVDRELASARSWMDTELAEEQADNLDYYYGEPFGNERDGYSQVVSRDVLETVEGIMPELMKLFASSDTVVEFDPIGPRDKENVEIEGHYVNHVFMNRYGGYRVLYDWFKDALLMKMGVIKVGWEKTTEVQFRKYDKLTKEELDLLEANESDIIDLVGTTYEVDTVEEIKSEDQTYYCVRIAVTREVGKPVIVPVPSEEFRIKERSTSIQDASFVAHEMTKTVGELIEMGIDEDDIQNATPAGTTETQVENARFTQPSEGTDSNLELSTHNDYEREVDFTEAYIRLYDPEAERIKLYRVWQIGKECVDFEEVDRIPMISLCPIMMPHKHTGLAVADLVRDIQEIRSSILRGVLDNLAITNAGRYTAVEGQVNLKDLIDFQIGGIVRQKMPNAVGRLDTPQIAPMTFNVLEGLDVQKENRTGVSRMTAGLDQNALSSHQTASAVNQVMTAAQAKILLIARNFAETGVKELFYELYQLVRENQTTADVFFMNGRFAVVNPTEWIDRHDIKVTVGIGNGNKDQQLFHLSQISNIMQQIGGTQYGYLITEENVFNLASEFIKNSGYLNPTQFISHPDTVEPPPPPPNPQLIAAQATMVQAETDKEYKGKQGGKLEADTTLAFEEFKWEKKKDTVEAALEMEQSRPVGLGDGK